MTPVIIAWRHLSSLLVDDDTIHLVQCMTIPLIASRAWWYPSTQASHDDTLSSHALHDDITHHKQCMMVPTISRDAWLNHSSQALYITIPDITYHCIRCLMISDQHIHCLMIPFISSCAWWSLSSQWLHDDTHQRKHRMTETIHHKHCMMIPFHTSLAWWYHSSQALHGDTYHRKPCIMNLSYPAMQYGNNWRDETQGLWRTTEDSRECSLDSLLETAGHLVNLTK